MPKTDPRIDAYIAKSADFAKPILVHLRKLVHEECPQVEETVKWGMPSFEHRGILCGMAAFKQHCAFSFWKHALVVEGKQERDGMGSFGKMTSMADLPSDAQLRTWLKRAVKLNEDGVRQPSKPKVKKAKLLKAPVYFLTALKKNKKAQATYEAFPPSKKNEYIEWITEAKAEETRLRRLTQAVEWMAKGKPRHWKYMKC